MVNWQSDYDHLMADNVLKRTDMDVELRDSKQLSKTQQQEMLTLVKILLGKANMPVTETNISDALDWIKDQDYRRLNTELEKRKKMKEFRKFMHIRKSLAERKFNERVQLSDVLGDRGLSVFEATTKKLAERRDEIEATFSDAEIADIGSISNLIGTRGFTLEKPQGSSIHHFLDHLKEVEKAKGVPTDRDALNAYTFIRSDFQSFVVEHNWAAAFENVKDFDGGEIRLPFEFTCFEFRISGIRVLIFLGETNYGIGGIMVSGINKRWYVCPHAISFNDGKLDHPALKRDQLSPSSWEYLHRLGEQIRAVCIMLDAKVAYGEKRNMVGPGLNKQRAREGKAPVRDYHVVSLMKRLRSPLNEDHEPTGIRRRLHWRRGHWRHFKTTGGEVRYSNEEGYTVSKTWINWQLVGDETLGFIEKHYKL